MDAMIGVKPMLLAMLAAIPAWGCTVVCGQDVEVHNGFTVEVLFQGKPLEAASVEVTSDADQRTITFATGDDDASRTIWRVSYVSKK